MLHDPVLRSRLGNVTGSTPPRVGANEVYVCTGDKGLWGPNRALARARPEPNLLTYVLWSNKKVLGLIMRIYKTRGLHPLTEVAVFCFGMEVGCA